MTNEKVAKDLEALTAEQLAELQGLVGAEAEKRGKWGRLQQMGDAEFAVFQAEVCAAGDVELRNAALAKRLKDGNG